MAKKIKQEEINEIKLQDFQQQMLEDLNDLSIKIDKLKNFIDLHYIFDTLDEDEKENLRKQLEGMEIYYMYLYKRCKAQKIIE